MARRSAGHAIRGVTAGLIAGIVFLGGQSSLTFALGGSIFAPVRLESTLALGAAALSRTYPLLGAALVGLGVNAASSALLGLIAVTILSRARRATPSALRLLLAGAAFGVLVWAVADLVIASIAFPQFAAADPLWHGAIAHVVFFGLPLAGYLVATRDP